MKIYLSGSTQNDNVGVGSYGTEASRMQHLADRVKYFLENGGQSVTVYRNSASMTLYSTVSDSNNKLNGEGIHVALHSNAGGGRGTECYYFENSVNGKRLSDLLYNAVAPLTVSSDRGSKSDHTLFSSGLYETRETYSIAALIEIMFHDNATDVADYLNKVDQIAKALAKAIYTYFNVTYKEPQAPTPTPVSGKLYRVQVGAFSIEANADKLIAELKTKGYNAIKVI